MDDARSRAEFVRRPGLADLRARAATGAFDAVIVRDETRLGGDLLRTGLLIQDLADHGVALWYYSTGERVRTDDATSRLILTVRNWGSEAEREKISSRTRENLERRARRGFVAGGVVFGYSNERSPEGVRRVVNDREARIVREIFERAARGDGIRSIAHWLTAQGVHPPRGWWPVLRESGRFCNEVDDDEASDARGGRDVVDAAPSGERLAEPRFEAGLRAQARAEAVAGHPEQGALRGLREREQRCWLALTGLIRPLPPRGGAHGWSPSAIHAMLRRPLYVGRPEWGHTHKTYRHGTKIRTEAHAHPLVAVDAPELAIISLDIWEAVRSRVDRRQKATSTRRGGPSKYLLGGFSRCTCGGPIQVERVRQSYASVPAYQCGWHRDRGAMVCANTLRRPVEIVDGAVIGWIRAHVLSRRVVLAVVAGVREAVARAADAPPDERDELDAEARRLRGEIDRLTRALAVSTAAVEPLVAGLDVRARRLREVEARLAALREAPSRAAAWGFDMERKIVERLEHLADTMHTNPAEGRRVIQALLVGPLRWTPVVTAEGPRYQIRGEATIGPLCLLERSERGGVQVASPAGFDLFPTIPVQLAA